MGPGPNARHAAAAGLAACLAVGASAGPSPGKNVKTYDQDGRLPIQELYRSMEELAKGKTWVMETVFTDQGLPIRLLRTKKKGPGLWVLAGIHGEEPAPPMAAARGIERFQALAARGVPVVLIPLCNPVGYSKNWRYPDAKEWSEDNPGHSVGDSDHLLLGKDGKPRAPQATSAQADALTRKVLALAKKYPPVLWVDLHEDDELAKGYVYSQGPKGRSDPAARAAVEKMVEMKYPIHLNGETRFKEKITDGVISDVQDGSIDELAASTQVFVSGRMRPGPSGGSVLVVETSSQDTPVEERVRVHAGIIGMLPELFELAAAPPDAP